MTTIQANIPDFLAKQAAEAAEREKTTVDHIIALPLTSQLSAWNVRDSVETRAARGRISDLDEILASVPDVPPLPGDELDRCPAELCRPSERPYEGTPKEIDYGGMETRRVHAKGTVCYRRERIFLSESLAGWDVGLSPTEEELVEVRFSDVLLGHIDEQTLSFKPLRPGHEAAAGRVKRANQK